MTQKMQTVINLSQIDFRISPLPSIALRNDKALNKKILMVDDDIFNIMAQKQVLKKAETNIIQ